jgi:hypothetical protein
MDVKASRAIRQAGTMIERTQERFEIKPSINHAQSILEPCLSFYDGDSAVILQNRRAYSADACVTLMAQGFREF